MSAEILDPARAAIDLILQVVEMAGAIFARDRISSSANAGIPGKMRLLGNASWIGGNIALIRAGDKRALDTASPSATKTGTSARPRPVVSTLSDNGRASA
ncbi:hypothetical protein GCM10009087_41260 [Sphingomonas oligophenolica]